MLTAIRSPEYLVNELVECYVEWRDCAAAVAAAYRRWSGGPHGEKHRWYSGYTASLDQEQSAAMSYERAVSDVKPWAQPAGLVTSTPKKRGFHKGRNGW
jgi:hypothetical protein